MVFNSFNAFIAVKPCQLSIAHNHVTPLTQHLVRHLVFSGTGFISCFLLSCGLFLIASFGACLVSARVAALLVMHATDTFANRTLQQK